MRWRLFILSVAIVALLLSTLLALPLYLSSIQSAHAQVPILPSHIVSSSRTPTVGAPSRNGLQGIFDPTTLGAIIQAIGAILGGLVVATIPIIYAIRQSRRVQQLEKEKEEEHERHEEDKGRARRQHEQDLENARRQHEQDLENARRQHEQDLENARRQHSHDMLLLEKEIRDMERKEQFQEQEALKRRTDELHAQDIEEHYRDALRADPHIASLQILGMKQPVKTEDIYVQMQVLKEARISVELDPMLHGHEDPPSPDEAFKQEWERLKSRISIALAPDDAILKFPRCVIVGDPGAGKTTLLKYLALRSVNNQLDRLPDLPFYIELNAFVGSEYQDLLDFAAAQWEPTYGIPKLDAGTFMHDKLKKGHALLLLDALDETIIGQNIEEAETSYQRVASAVLQLASRYPHAPIVVTARTAGYQRRSLLKGFTQLEVLDFRIEDIRRFVERWFADPLSVDRHRCIKASELTTKLESNPHVLSLASNPLLLLLIVIVYEAQQNLPGRRAELYRRCVDLLLFAWDAERNIHRRREFTTENKLSLLKEIAWHFHSRGKRYFSENELLEVITKFLPMIDLPANQNRRVLAEIATESGLLKAFAAGLYGFLHLTFQEYFVAQYIYEHNALETLLAYLGNSWWEEVVLLYVGIASDASPLLQTLLSKHSEPHLCEDIFHSNLILAGYCLTTRPTVRDTSLRETITAHLFHTLITSPYSLIKEQCTDVLAAIRGEKVNARLLALLADEQIEMLTRRHIAHALGMHRDQATARHLLHLLANKEINPAVRCAIAEAIGAINNPSVARDLLRMLDTPALEADVREAIILALGMLCDPSVAHDLLYHLQKPHIEQRIRCTIARALATLGDHSVTPRLLELLCSEQVPQRVRCSIAEALGALGKHDAIPKLLTMLADEQIDPQVRYYIAETVGRLSERSVIPHLWNIYNLEDIDQNIRKYIVVTIGRLGDKTVIPQLLDMLENVQTDLHIRRSAAQVLGLLGDQTLIPRLLHLLKDTKVHPQVRREIAETLGMLGARPIVHELQTLLGNEKVDRGVRQSIAHALGKLGDHTDIPPLMSLLTNARDPYVRMSIVEVLGTLSDSSVVPDLMHILCDRQIPQRVRQSIANVLGLLANDKETVEKLSSLIHTPDIADHLYRTLWIVSRRAGVRVPLPLA